MCAHTRREREKEKYDDKRVKTRHGAGGAGDEITRVCACGLVFVTRVCGAGRAQANQVHTQAGLHTRGACVAGTEGYTRGRVLLRGGVGDWLGCEARAQRQLGSERTYFFLDNCDGVRA